jgi:tetrahydromethanopterin S-methyltransferase subunit A
MDQQGKKKEWVAPELAVLARSHPEETVLAACKYAAISGSVHAENYGCAEDVCTSVCSVWSSS